MSEQKVLKMGSKLLHSKASIVTEFKTFELHKIIQDLKDTMLSKGGVGIAAPQIGHSIRVICIGFDKNTRYPNEEPIPFMTLINPRYLALSEDMVDAWEGCLSVPGMRGLVSRYQKIQYFGFDIAGKPNEGVAENFFARIIQHECDHLDGVLFPSRIKDFKNFGFEDTLEIETYLQKS